MVIVMYKLFKPPLDARLTAHPRGMEAVDPLLERVKPLFDQVSFCIVELTAQPNSKEGSPIAVAINEKHSIDETLHVSSANQKSKISGDVREIVFLGQVS